MGLVHNLLMQFFTLGSSKIEVFETFFLDTMISYNEHPRYVKHGLGRIYVFFTLFGYSARAEERGGGGAPMGLLHNLLMQFFTLDSSIPKFSKLYFESRKMTIQDK